MATFTHDGTENRMRWDRRKRDFMEVWYATANHRPSGVGVWFRYTLTSSTDAPAYCELWGFAFDPNGKSSFAAKIRFPIDQLGSSNGRDDGALVRIGDAWLSENHLEGRVTKDDRALEWSLDFTPFDGCFQHIPERLRGRVEKRISMVCSPNLSVPFFGTVRIDDDELVFDGELGCQSHRWGRQHSDTWSWAHCSTFDDGADAIFEGVAARTSIGRVPAPTTTLVFLRYEGIDLAFNDLKWALRAKSRYELPTWAFSARNESFKIAGAARATVDRFVQVSYADPNGSSRFCVNSEIADLAIEIYRREGPAWRHHGSLTALRTAHLEFGRREPFPELPVTL
ncbi:MAG: hypothetical protein M3277_08820 [Actinomycetota bacterium]|nr:hypothetical protein [Actinomycetota bacterium]